MIINCAAVDDEYLALDVIAKYIQKVPFLRLRGTFDSAISFMAYLKENTVDVLFLDIQMKELTGIQLLKSLSNPPLVIFTTAYDAYAVESYELNVIDYLLKPISFERFVQAVDKAYNKLLPQNSGYATGKDIAIGNTAENFFFVKSGTSLERISYDDILYIKGERDYLKVVTHSKSLLVLLKFKYFEDLLPSDQFYRVHRSYMVAMDKIEKIQGNLIYIADTKIPMGNNYRNSFIDEVTKQR
ncbi:LytR/AlgR family response regulator transcription factor [Ulvibacterium sp.]|uniref:LytR/AlgR family response regulator transcription factor n=1 Tax=Ulvibacterium sp. TaxID=2665914 RepID=UPI003BAB65E6